MGLSIPTLVSALSSNCSQALRQGLCMRTSVYLLFSSWLMCIKHVLYSVPNPRVL